MFEPFLALALSTHLGLSAEYNEIHPHFRLHNDNKIVGVYHNSIDNISLYAGHRIELNEKIGIEIVAATGYPIAPIVPFIRTTYDVNNKLKLFTTPVWEGYDNHLNPGILLGIEIKLYD